MKKRLFGIIVLAGMMITATGCGVTTPTEYLEEEVSQEIKMENELENFSESASEIYDNLGDIIE